MEAGAALAVGLVLALQALDLVRSGEIGQALARCTAGEDRRFFLQPGLEQLLQLRGAGVGIGQGEGGRLGRRRRSGRFRLDEGRDLVAAGGFELATAGLERHPAA